MSKNKLYFECVDSTWCHELQYFLERAEPGETEITLIEAVPDNNNPDYIYCSLVGEVGDRCECKKSECKSYTSKSGRGVCSHRGRLYTHGEEVKFNVTDLLQEHKA